MLVHRGDELVSRQLQLACGAQHDADVGLVRDQPVDVGFHPPGFGQHGTRDAVEHIHGELEDRRAIHRQ